MQNEDRESAECQRRSAAAATPQEHKRRGFDAIPYRGELSISYRASSMAGMNC